MNKNKQKKLINMIKTFVPENVTDHYNKILQFTKIKPEPKIHKIHDGIIAIDNKNEAFGVFDNNKNFINESICRRGNHKRHIPNKNCINKIQKYDFDVIYCGGNTMHHFGHFLIEGLSRVYPYLYKKYQHCKLIFIDNHSLPNYAKTLLNLLGVPDENIIVLNHSAQFRTVYIPDQAFDITSYSSTIQAKVYKKIASNTNAHDKFNKIYVSRTAMGDRKTFGEEQIQNIFEQNGYKIIYPEQLPLPEQIGLIKNCKYLAGLAGTALHLATFMKPGGTVIQIKRNTVIGDNTFVQNLINKTTGLNFILIWGSTEPVPSAHFSQQPQIVGITPQLLKFFDWAKFKYSDTDLQENTQSVQEYKTAYSQYIKNTKNNKIKKSIAKICSCFLPTRQLRRMFRNYISTKLKI